MQDCRCKIFSSLIRAIFLSLGSNIVSLNSTYYLQVLKLKVKGNNNCYSQTIHLLSHQSFLYKEYEVLGVHLANVNVLQG
jgi:hypothetical protein